MITLTVTMPNGNTIKGQFEEGITSEELLKRLDVKPEHQIICCKVANSYKRLSRPIKDDCEIEMCDIRDSYANMAYQQSLCLLYVKAVHDVLGKDTEVTITNSLSKGLYTAIHVSSVNDETLQSIENRMRELVAQDVSINEKRLDRDDAIHYLKKNGPKDVLNLVFSAYDINSIYLNSLEDECEIAKDHLVPTTGYLKLFELHRYRNGILLRFPNFSSLDEVPPYQEQALLYDAFSEANRWDKLLGVNYASDLNEKVINKEYKDLIMLNEALHERKIADIASTIQKAGKRIILIAGPSSSGKTTFAKRLCTQLRVIGMRPLYLGTDDYFVNREEMVADEDGQRDLESLDAVDIKLFTEQMNDLLSGKKVDLPEFNFIKGEKEFGKRITSIDSTQPVVIEGIHGLNPKLTEGIPASKKFKIYISPLTQLNIDHHHRVPTTDARMLRRLVRDNRTRGRSAAETIDSWPSVRAGEEKYIFPFNSEADVFFNSECTYELAVLKKYAEPLLKEINIDQKEYPEARRMLKFLQFFVSIQDDSMIANNSIIREFIGGSVVVN